jgi:hypothetical protein
MLARLGGFPDDPVEGCAGEGSAGAGTELKVVVTTGVSTSTLVG